MHFSAGIIVGSLISAAVIWLLRFRSRRPAIPAQHPLLPHLRGWVDYDRSQLPALNPMERVDYLEKRVRLVVIRPLRRILDTEIEPTTDSSALLIFGVSLCCAIEALGKFLNGGTGAGGNANRFRTFLSRYLHTDFQTKSLGTDTYGRVLWKHYRNGLAHGFAVCHGGFEGTKGQPYFVVKSGSLMLNPYEFYDDFVAGFEQYLADLRATGGNGQLFSDFDTVFIDVFINGN